MVKRTEILHGKCGAKGVDYIAKEMSGRCGENNIINIEKEIGGLVPFVKGEERSIGGGSDEPDGASMSSEPLKPRPRGLLEPIERFLETAHMRWVARIDKTGGLLAVNLFG
jgi:hypothetical protein